MKKLFLIICLLISSTASGKEDFCTLLLSDPHLDPSLAVKMPINPETIGSDLDAKTYQQFKKIIPQSKAFKTADAMIIIGDLIGHTADESQRVAIHKQLLGDIGSLEKPAYLLFGNNDSLQGNYQEFEGRNGSTYQLAKSSWPLSLSGFSSDKNLQICHSSGNDSYPCLLEEQEKEGHFSVMLAEHLQLIALNSVLLNGDYLMNYQETADNALQWLSEQLKRSGQMHHQVLLTMHIPPGLNLYSKTYHFREKFNHEPIYQKAFIHRLQQAVNQDHASILAIFSAHTHYDETHFIKLNEELIPVIINPGLSTHHGNTPGFKLACFSHQKNDWRLKNVSAYRFDEEKFKFISYQSLKKDLCQQKSLKKCFVELLSKPKQLEEFVLKNYYAGNQNHPEKKGILAKELITISDNKAAS